MSPALRPVVAVVQVRMTSTRLPGKVLKPLAGLPLICRMLERVFWIRGVDCVAVALADGAANDAVLDALDGFNLVVSRGPENDVLARTARAAREAQAATVMRITSDCPLIDPDVSGSVLAAYTQAMPAGVRYARTSATEGFPHGFDTEVMDVESLYAADREATLAFDREHVTPFIREREERFPGIVLIASPDRRNWRLTVDTPEDYELVAEVYRELYPINPAFGYAAISDLFARRPELITINAQREQVQHALRR